VFTRDLRRRRHDRDAGAMRMGGMTGREVRESAMKLSWSGFRGSDAG
jgi:hypothetical protein